MCARYAQSTLLHGHAILQAEARFGYQKLLGLGRDFLKDELPESESNADADFN
jgi:hypothetical protein